VLPRLDPARFQGVCVFDPELRTWVICDARGRVLPRHASPVSERAAFVIYDDARCRGADLQLRTGAVGLLTLGPGICKDKVGGPEPRRTLPALKREAPCPLCCSLIRLRAAIDPMSLVPPPAQVMQAAGRLRHLAAGKQSVRFAGAADVTAHIKRARGGAAAASPGGAVSARDVLRWVMANTVEATLRGTLTWVAQGLHFASTAGAPQRALLPEVLQLDAMYGNARLAQPVAAIVSRMASAAAAAAATAGGLSSAAVSLVGLVQQRSEHYGSGHSVAGDRGAVNEECERELEVERETEREQERQVPRVEAVKEADWDYEAALVAAGPDQLLAAGVPLKRLSQVAALLEPPALRCLGWSGSVWATDNFVQCAVLGEGQAHNEYLRPLDALLAFPDGQAVLLSEREADGLLRTLRLGGGRKAAGASLQSLCYAEEAEAVEGGVGEAVLAAGAVPAARLRPPELASMAMFNGQAAYGSARVRAAVRQLAARHRQEAEAIVTLRGKLPALARSDLERACDG
jgi:hypothetical protein